MRHILAQGLFRAGLAGVATLMVLTCWSTEASAAKVKVNCKNQSISGALSAGADVPGLVIIAKGHCTENIVINRDDVTIKSNGAVLTITPADVNVPTIFIDAARAV